MSVVVTHNFLLKICATPPRADALRLGLVLKTVSHTVFFESALLDSNQEPQRYKLCALTIELRAGAPDYRSSE
jgi:hypothetical protein